MATLTLLLYLNLNPNPIAYAAVALARYPYVYELQLSNIYVEDIQYINIVIPIPNENPLNIIV